MCGIAGFVSGRSDIGAVERRRDVEELIEALRHRGPDANGAWLDHELDVGLGHRRLSIVDLSPSGAQPMASLSGRYVITFNGEIYNFRELRAEYGLSDSLRGSGDTEVLVALIEKFGVEGALRKADGMFALAVWDRKDRSLCIARDRFGEKPLYYSLQNGQLIFVSELSALLRSSRFVSRIAEQSLNQYVRFGYYPGETCVLDDVRKLKPGCIARISHADLKNKRLASVWDIRPEAYWDATEAFATARASPFKGSFDDAVHELDDRLSAIVKRQVLADVPVGAFLSGGIDSSTVAALMSKCTATNVKTFTIGYEEPEFDESEFARNIAKKIGSDHTELKLRASEALSMVPSIGSVLDEPLGDQSYIPTYFVSKLARGKVSVALTGDGGDELLGGYVRHSWIQRVWNYTGGGNPFLRNLASGALGVLDSDAWDRLGSTARRFKLGPVAQMELGFKVQKLRGCLQSRSEIEMYQRLTSKWWDLEGVFPGRRAENEYPNLPQVTADTAEKTMFWDMMTYLPGNCLTKVDRASMSQSLETRTPFLDHRLVEWSWSLPTSYKIKGGKGKRVLRAVLNRYVPSAMLERPKQGFGFPVATWLRGPLRDWAESLLDASRLRSDGFFRPEPIRAAWERHLTGGVNMSVELWGILMFQSWLDQNYRPSIASQGHKPACLVPRSVGVH